MHTNAAPLLLFIYNRPDHLRQCLTYLSENIELDHTEVFIFADGPKVEATIDDQKKIKEARDVARNHAWKNKVYFREQETNQGLAKSIIGGVTEIIQKYGRVIVLEDDLLVGRNFLRYMNDALNKYALEDRVAQISGFTFPAQKIPFKQDAFLIPLTTTWGWATWQRYWDSVDFFPTDTNNLLANPTLRYEFDLQNAYPYHKMLKQQMSNPDYGSWGIRFWWQVFKDKGLVLYPDHSLVQHGDNDLSGTHASNFVKLNVKNWDNLYEVKHFPTTITCKENYFQFIKDSIRSKNSLYQKATDWFIRFMHKKPTIFGRSK